MNPRIGTDTCGNHSRKRSVNATTHPPVNKILIRILCLGLVSREGRLTRMKPVQVLKVKSWVPTGPLTVDLS